MRTFAILILSSSAMQAYATFTPQAAMAPVTASAGKLAADALSRRQAMGLAFTVPLGAALAPQSAKALQVPIGPKKATAQARDGVRAKLLSKEGIKDGRVPGADSYGTAAVEGTSGVYGLPSRTSEGRVAEEFYKFRGGSGVKKAPVRSGYIAPSEELLETSDVINIAAVALMGFFVGSAGTFALHRFRLASSTAAQEPLLAASV